MTTLRNNVQLIGRAGRTPEIKTFDKDRKLARFSMATNEVYYNQKGERVEETQWHNLVAWGKTADIIEKLITKGKEIAVSGKLINRNWDDKDGNKRYATEVEINQIIAFEKSE
ncbi:MAG: single-stranded DNA-binding protein [Bacteroidetes bacterium]|jgi:single-strand DNA-binding protein|nr:single-stranded DNA-binding protein [Bacteroidota bacterium]